MNALNAGINSIDQVLRISRDYFENNGYKVYFTNGILGIFDLTGEAPKYAKLKCPHCQTKDWCKIERK